VKLKMPCTVVTVDLSKDKKVLQFSVNKVVMMQMHALYIMLSALGTEAKTQKLRLVNVTLETDKKISILSVNQLAKMLFHVFITNNIVYGQALNSPNLEKLHVLVQSMIWKVVILTTNIVIKLVVTKTIVRPTLLLVLGTKN